MNPLRPGRWASPTGQPDLPALLADKTPPEQVQAMGGASGPVVTPLPARGQDRTLLRLMLELETAVEEFNEQGRTSELVGGSSDAHHWAGWALHQVKGLREYLEGKGYLI